MASVLRVAGSRGTIGVEKRIGSSRMLHLVRPQVVAAGPGPLFLTGWGAFAAFVMLAAFGIGGWYFLLRRNRERIASEQSVSHAPVGPKRRERLGQCSRASTGGRVHAGCDGK